MIAQLPDPSSYVAMGWVLTVIVALVTGLGGSYLVYLNIQVAKKKLAAPPLPTGQQPQPFKVEQVKEYVLKPELEKAVADLTGQISGVKREFEKKFTHTEVIFRDRFHKLDSDLEGIAKTAQNNSELATEQFQNIEGRLGELKSTTEHTNAMAVRTDQRVAKMAEDLPDKIANAIARNGRRT
jgi:hypothetical protein